jgi:signal transduction histidine kinase
MLNTRWFIAAILLLTVSVGSMAQVDVKNDTVFLKLRNDMHNAFNENDSARFYPAVKKLEDYLLEHGDMHLYYNQRCNEIVFFMNRKQIFEAYKASKNLAQELREKKEDKEMYMAVNMQGHLFNYWGNKEEAKRCFRDAINRMKAVGYWSNIPPIYMNLVNVEISDDPQLALQHIDTAIAIARQHSPERVFDIETRRAQAYYEMGDTTRFYEGYKAYKEGVAMGLTSVHGRSLEVFYLVQKGRIDEALKMANEELSDEGYQTLEGIYRRAGRWKEAYDALKHSAASNDSVNSILLSNSMEGIRNELRIYDAERKASHNRTIALVAAVVTLLVLMVCLMYITFTRRRHMKQLNLAYQHALQSDQMKSAFIRNVSHEVRTPLNIISGFAQVIADPSLETGYEERRHMSQMMIKNTRIITMLVDEMLELSHSESGVAIRKEDHVKLNKLLLDLMAEEDDNLCDGTSMRLRSQLADDFTFTTNEMMLRRMVSALLNNATKNTERGFIDIKAETSDGQLTIIVEDSGCGIPPDEAEHVFDRFVKLDTFKVGIGLGLPLCRNTAERMGGTVRLDTSYSAPEGVGGKGARFIITLPL